MHVHGLSVRHLLRCTHVSARDLSILSGIVHWHHLLNRPLLSIFDHTYRFLDDNGRTANKNLPDSVKAGFAISVTLGIFWTVDLRRPLSGLLSASGASTGSGYGAAVIRTSSLVTDWLGRLAHRSGRWFSSSIRMSVACRREAI